MILRGLATRLTVLVALAVATPAAAQPIPVPPQPDAIPLKTGGVSGSRAPESWFKTGAQRTARNVAAATLTPVLPARDKATGAAVIVAPGGAFRALSMDSEGYEVARRLADHGIAAFVLKYRLVPTAPDPADYAREMAELMKGVVATPAVPARLATPADAVEDGVAALRLVRARAKDFGVDPTRVGIMGFSAGGMTALSVALQSDPRTMPAFIAPIYPPMNAVTVPAAAPPMFVVLATDDPLFGRTGYGLVESWVKARKRVEFHLFQRGGHGFGSGKAGTTSDGWLDQFVRWLDMNRLLKPTR